MCPYCKKPVTVKVEHPNVGRDGKPGVLENHWMAYCKSCDMWLVIPMEQVK